MSKVQESFYQLAPHLIDITVDEGGSRTYEGRNFVYFRTGLFSELFKSMKEVIGPVANRKIKEFGVDAGSDIAKGMDEAFKDTGPVEILQIAVKSGFDIKNIMNLRPTDDISQLHKIFGYGRYVGWLGPVEIKKYSDNDEIVVEVENTFESYSYGQSGEKQCKFMTGVFQGLMNYYWDVEDLDSEEVKCACQEEHDKCSMKVVAE